MKVMAALAQMFGAPKRRLHRHTDPDLEDAKRRIEMLDLQLDVVLRHGLDRISQAQESSKKRNMRSE